MLADTVQGSGWVAPSLQQLAAKLMPSATFTVSIKAKTLFGFLLGSENRF